MLFNAVPNFVDDLLWQCKLYLNFSTINLGLDFGSFKYKS